MQGARVLASLNKLLTLAAPRPKTDEINQLYRHQQKHFHYGIVLCWVMEMKNSSYRAKIEQYCVVYIYGILVDTLIKISSPAS